ncbi:membrane-associated protein, putative [Bodo saltans]|uniref:Membrane-associated protein, putative n=1 Tax=Bodo saltans TaxID=75058 RepID=A0A0S4J186_BODSA|nr:membrane-associated protein, putative [Bodo saltans]|eukprot:CUG78716.1 membrane-associated protein, putative [Bodo saltans]
MNLKRSFFFLGAVILALGLLACSTTSSTHVSSDTAASDGPALLPSRTTPTTHNPQPNGDAKAAENSAGVSSFTWPHIREPETGEWRRFAGVICDFVVDQQRQRHHDEKQQAFVSPQGRFLDDYASGNDPPTDLGLGQNNNNNNNNNNNTGTDALRRHCRLMETSKDSSAVITWIRAVLFPTTTTTTTSIPRHKTRQSHVVVVSNNTTAVSSRGWNWTFVADNDLSSTSARGAGSTTNPLHNNVVSHIQRFEEHPRSRFCYYTVRNACIEQKQLVLYAGDPTNSNDSRSVVGSSSSLSSSVDVQLKGKPFRLCNELRRKFRFHYSVARRSMPAAAPATASDITTRNVSRRHAHISACWQYYGFHLFQCLAALFTMQLQHNMPDDVDMYLFNHASSLHESSRDHFSHQLVLGNSASFLDGNEEGHSRSKGKSSDMNKKKIASNAYWGMWAQNTKSPSHIREVFNGAQPAAVEGGNGSPSSSPTLCYERMLVGQVVHHELTVPQRRIHRWWMQSVLLEQYRISSASSTIANHPSKSSNGDNDVAYLMLPRDGANEGALRVTIADRQRGKRQGSRSIVNIGLLVKSIVKKLVKIADDRCLYSGTWRRDAFENGASHHHQLHRHGCVRCPHATSLSSPKDGGVDAGRQQQHAKHEEVIVCLTDWATLPLSTQAAVAYASDVVIAAHGGGNTWIALQRPQTVFIELWHAPYVPRNVFVSMAREYNVRYYAHLRRDVATPGNFMHQDVTVEIPQLMSLLDAAVNYLVFVAGLGSGGAKRLT